MEKVNKGKDDLTCCWLWTGSTSGSGYGQFWNGIRNIPAHWFLLGSAVPTGKEACHRCDTKLCVRPSHIFIGTRSDNMQDMLRKGRNNSEAARRGCRSMLNVRKLHYGESNHASKLTAAQVLKILAAPRGYGTGVVLARRYGVSATVISGIRKGSRWENCPI